MNTMDAGVRVLLIGGTSHAGKSTLVRALGAHLGWTVVSTDSLARHPGRPWRTPPDVVPLHVVDHYGNLQIDELIADVQAHYRRLRPRIEGLIAEHAYDAAAEGFVLEGSALLPELLAAVDRMKVAPFWLTASDEILEARIRTESGLGIGANFLIEKFIGRTLAFNREMTMEAGRLALPVINVGRFDSLDDLVAHSLTLLRPA